MLLLLLLQSLLLVRIKSFELLGCPERNEMSSQCTCSGALNVITVVCNYDGKVTEKIYKGEKTLHINYLKITNSNLSSLPSEFFQGIETVHNLDLSHNNFKVFPEALKNISNLQVLNLSHNKFTNIEMKSIANLKNLQHIDMSFNTIARIPHSTVQNSILNRIDFSNNDITSIASSAFTPFPSLKWLNLADNTGLNDLNNTIFPDHFTELDINNTATETINVCQLMLLHDLQKLTFHNTKMICTCELAHLNEKVKLNPSSYNDDWKCLNDTGDLVHVSDLHLGCLDKTNKCKVSTIDNETGFAETPQDIDLRINILKQKSEEIEIAWQVSNFTNIIGYRVMVISDDDNEEVYMSDILHPSVLSHMISGSEVKQGMFQVCVQVYGHNISVVSKQGCEEVSVMSLTIYVGVMAGVVFLIPFSVILVCIVKYDRNHQKKDQLYFAAQSHDEKEPFTVVRSSNDKITTVDELKITNQHLEDVKNQETNEKQLQSGTRQQPTSNLETASINPAEIATDKSANESGMHPDSCKSCKFKGDNPTFVEDLTDNGLGPEDAKYAKPEVSNVTSVYPASSKSTEQLNTSTLPEGAETVSSSLATDDTMTTIPNITKL